MNRFEDFRQGRKSVWETLLRHMGCISINGVFVTARLWKEVNWWSGEETTIEKTWL
jgi:hypothetical protein